MMKLGRLLDYPRHKREGGSHRGIDPNAIDVHQFVTHVCNDDNGINANTYHLLTHAITLDGLLDLVEMKAYRDSWSHAEMLNSDERRREDERLRAALGT